MTFSTGLLEKNSGKYPEKRLERQETVLTQEVPVDSRPRSSLSLAEQEVENCKCLMQAATDAAGLDSDLQESYIKASRNLARLQLLEETFWKKKVRSLDDNAVIKRAAVDHFEGLIKAVPCLVTKGLLKVILSKISPDQNVMLMALPTSFEVQQAVLSILADGTASPDGFLGSFLAACWDIVGKDLLDETTFLFQGGPLLRAVSASQICLVLKSAPPKRFLDFRPISLCNCLYKIFSKVITARLSQVMPLLISAEKGAFVKGRSITENIELSQEFFEI
ncbi:uncharacterized protein LOC131249710 [Magnolia sinica]|uniref:uncharacterized protein LOC131249710 n=1 Tax=Magnolia sinica TaxID=86752 RepID=UPI002659AFC4|nr:uncharacterized protein LOC131249710 [Magnolia sinica]